MNNNEIENGAKVLLADVFIANTRFEARDKMQIGETFEAPTNLSKYNKGILVFWMKECGYEKIKQHRKGYDLYKPISNAS